MSPHPSRPSDRVDALARRLGRLAELQPVTVVLLTGAADLGSHDDRAACVAGFRRLAREAEVVGLDLALEPIHPSAAAEFSIVSDLAGAAAFIEKVGSSRLGLLFDTWHLRDGDAALESLTSLSHLVKGVHVADVRDPSRGWADRLLPGDGILDLAAVVRALRGGGFRGFLDLEIFSDDGRWGTHLEDSLWDVPPEELVMRGVEAVRRLARSGARIFAQESLGILPPKPINAPRASTREGN